MTIMTESHPIVRETPHSLREMTVMTDCMVLLAMLENHQTPYSVENMNIMTDGQLIGEF
jgi:hypothetical protein